jgi:PAS domain S-box-containing protein
VAWEFTPFCVPLLAAALVSAIVAAFAWRHRTAPAATAFALQMSGLAGWTFATAIELSASELPAKILWSKLRYPGTLLTIGALLVVASQYSGFDAWVTRRNLLLVSIVPAITLALVFTNERHGLIWETIEQDPLSPATITTHGAWFWVHIGYSYLLLLAATIMILIKAVRSRERRREAVPLLLAALVPWAGNALHLAGLTPSEIDPTPFAFTISSLALAWGLIHLGLLDILPVARTAVIEGMSDGMLVLDRESRVVSLNPAAARILDVADRDVIGQRAADVLARWPEVVALYATVRETHAEVTLGDGDARREYDLKISPISDRRGEYAGRVAVFRDVTARKRAEQERARLFQAVADEQSRLRTLIRSSRDGIVLFGKDLSLLVVNEPALHLLRLPGRPEDWLGRGLDEALDCLGADAAEVRSAVLAERGRVLRGDEPAAEGEFEIAPNVVHWVNLPVVGDDPMLGRLLVLRDTTAERALEQLREDLTHTMVHDLRSPLTAISGALDVIELSGHEAFDAKQREMLSLARGGTERLLLLVNSILDLSQLESGRMPLERARVPLAPVVSETLDFESTIALQKNLYLENAVSETHPPLWADPVLLRRVLQNLVGNAVKFTPQGGRVSVAADREPGALRVDVRDTGPGVPAEIHGRLFQKFVTGAQKERGNGLGLAFCRLAVEAHGGRINAASREGGGAVFSFTLPLAPEE